MRLLRWLIERIAGDDDDLWDVPRWHIAGLTNDEIDELLHE